MRGALPAALYTSTAASTSWPEVSYDDRTVEISEGAPPYAQARRLGGGARRTLCRTRVSRRAAHRAPAARAGARRAARPQGHDRAGAHQPVRPFGIGAQFQPEGA